MLTRAQRILLQRARRECRIPEDDYRDAIHTISGLVDCRSSTDSRLTHEHLDKLLKWFEFTYWSQVDAGMIQHVPTPKSVFRERWHWRDRNPMNGPTTRDRYSVRQLERRISAAQQRLFDQGRDAFYCDAIRRRTGWGWAYLAALERTAAGFDKELSRNQRAAAQRNPALA